MNLSPHHHHHQVIDVKRKVSELTRFVIVHVDSLTCTDLMKAQIYLRISESLLRESQHGMTYAIHDLLSSSGANVANDKYDQQE
jgi:hypothetical protein